MNRSQRLQKLWQNVLLSLSLLIGSTALFASDSQIRFDGRNARNLEDDIDQLTYFNSESCGESWGVDATTIGSDVTISGLEHSPSTGLLYGYAWSGSEEVFYSIDPQTASVQVAEAFIEPQPHVQRSLARWVV